MSIFDFNDPLIIQRRAGTPEDPYQEITQNIMIKENNVILQEIPDKFSKVQVSGNGITWIEIESGSPTENQYKVNYLFGIIEFHESRNGLTNTFTYQGTGKTYLPYSRVWTELDNTNTNVVKTLQDVVGNAEATLAITDEFNHKGEYNPATEYTQRNIVTFNNSTYFAVANSIGIEPGTDETKWELISKGFSFKNNYDNGVQYYPGDVVYYDSEKTNFVCKTKPPIGTLPTNITYWDKLISVKDAIDTINATNDAIIQAEDDRVIAENTRVSQENTRQSNETTRESNETTRISNENTRQTNETTRIDAENTRQSNETTRESNETTRISNENTRQTNETNRQEAINNLNHLGEYNPATTYEPRNVVSYLGSSYMCILQSTGNLPTNTTYWKPVSLKGEKGASLSFQDEYDNATQYLVNDLVTYEGSVYVCILDSLGNLPTNTTYWELFLGNLLPVISETEPTQNLQEGLTWYKPSTFDTKMYLDGAFRAVGGIPPVVSTTEPVTNLQEGLIWYNPYVDEVKIYLDGAFRVAGGSGNSLKAYRNSVILGADTSSVAHGIQDFNKNIDILFVYKNSVYLHEGIDYQLSTDGTTIESLTGNWLSTTEFNFLVIATIPNPTAFKNIRLENLVTIGADGTTNIPIGITEFNKDTDILEVIQDVPLFEGENYSINADGQSIDLIGYSLNTGQKIMFYVWKQIREISNVLDGQLLANDSVGNEKLGTDIKVGSLSSLFTTIKDSITNAINEIVNKIGDLTGLSTTNKDNLVSAVNEIDSNQETHATNSSNPHSVTKTQIGLENVSNNLQATKTEFDAHLADTMPHGTVSNITYYVDAVNGNDANDGLTSGNALKTIMAAIKKLPSIIRHTVTISLAAGTYAEHVYLLGFVGSGTINIVGGSDLAAADNYKIDYLTIKSCGCFVIVQGLNATKTSITGSFLINRCIGYYLLFCKSTSADLTMKGVEAKRSFGYIQECDFSNKNYAIEARAGAIVFSNNNSGSDNNYGLNSQEASTIGKYGTQPTGTTANESTGGGGEIR